MRDRSTIAINTDGEQVIITGNRIGLIELAQALSCAANLGYGYAKDDSTGRFTVCAQTIFPQDEDGEQLSDVWLLTGLSNLAGLKDD